MDNEKAPKKSKWKLVLLIIIPIIAIISIGIGYMVASEKSFADIRKSFEKEESHSLLLEEFLVNIKSPGGDNRYLKIKLALMYTEQKDGEILNANINRIRDIIIFNLRKRESEEVLDSEAIDEMKLQIMEDINLNLEENLVKDVYITDLVIQ